MEKKERKKVNNAIYNGYYNLPSNPKEQHKHSSQIILFSILIKRIDPKSTLIGFDIIVDKPSSVPFKTKVH